MITFITGGGRSGKSTFAEEIAFSYNSKVYVATALAFDNEMKYRIKEHQKTRDDSWITIECYENIVDKLKVKVDKQEVILLDCLTNLISNMMIMNSSFDWDNLKDEDADKVEQNIKKEISSIIEYVNLKAMDLIVVSNEVGMGLVPEYPLGRRFRDIAGRMNQYVASVSTEAYLVVSGLKIKLK